MPNDNNIAMTDEELAAFSTHWTEFNRPIRFTYQELIHQEMNNKINTIFYGNTYNPFAGGGGIIGNSANPDIDPPTQASGSTVQELKTEVDQLKKDNAQLWDAVREIVAENNQLKEKLEGLV